LIIVSVSLEIQNSPFLASQYKWCIPNSSDYERGARFWSGDDRSLVLIWISTLVDFTVAQGVFTNVVR